MTVPGDPAPQISVVVPTRDRPEGLARLLAGLARQSLPSSAFEVLVVDDGSRAPVRVGAGGLDAQVVRHERSRGPAAARNSGWQRSRAAIVAFIDDDCVPDERWLVELLRASGPDRAVVQGRVAPMPEHAHALTPLDHTIAVGGITPLFISANVAYPRALLQRLDGFDETFTRACGEDVELGARVLAAGAPVRFAAQALVLHEVRRLSLRDHIRHTRKWTDGVRALAMHPELRSLLVGRVFWKPTHPWLLAALAALVARRPGIAALAIAPWLVHYRRAYAGHPRQLAAALPPHLIIDLAEIAVAVAGSVRHRTLML